MLALFLKSVINFVRSNDIQWEICVDQGYEILSLLCYRDYTISELCGGEGGLLSTLPFISQGFSLSFSKLWLIDNEKQKQLNLFLRSKRADSAFASCAVTFSELWNICRILWQIMVSASIWIIFNYNFKS